MDMKPYPKQGTFIELETMSNNNDIDARDPVTGKMVGTLPTYSIIRRQGDIEAVRFRTGHRIGDRTHLNHLEIRELRRLGYTVIGGPQQAQPMSA
jgi:hypothetical protein